MQSKKWKGLYLNIDLNLVHSEATVNKSQKWKTCRKGSKLTIFVTAFDTDTHTGTLDFNYSLSLTNLIFSQQAHLATLPAH